jgi:hypothetical protein
LLLDWRWRCLYFFSDFSSIGITCIETSPAHPHTLIVGSYDETVWLYDLRKPTQECLARVDVGMRVRRELELESFEG